MTADPATVKSWRDRAQAYDRFCRRWDIFSLLSTRLIESLPTDLIGAVLDIGAGSGLTSELLLKRRPNCEAILIDPTEKAMLDIARKNLDGRTAQFFTMSLDEVAAQEIRAESAIASASMQFLELDAAFASLSRIMHVGGRVAFNLWWHHWEETADLEGMEGWRPFGEEACREAALLPPLPDPVLSKIKPKTREEMMSACLRSGFRFLSNHRDDDFGVYPLPLASIT